MQTGELIAGRYELERELGEGGTATVWLGRDRTLERPVAIKFMQIADARDREPLTRQFLREARIAAAVHHRNVIQILDFGVHEGTPFMAMEALAGETMADRFDRGQGFALREVVEIAARCLEGLAAVHEAGIVHRDLKPENVFLVPEPTGVYPKLLDFGISKALDKRGGRHSAIPTEAGRIVGTPEYMSPEQARGLTDLDLRTDLYSLGVVMYEALTGRLPYDAEHMGDVLIKVVAGGAPEVVQLVPAVGRPISDVVARAMQPKREQRFASAMEMRSALLAAAQPLLAQGADAIALPQVARRAQSAEARLHTREEPLGSDVQRAAAVVAALDPPRRPRPKIWPIAAGAGAASIAVAAFAFLALREPAKGPSPPRFIVVQGAPATPATAALPPSDPAAQAAGAEGAVAAPAEPAAPEPARKAVARANAAAVAEPQRAQRVEREAPSSSRRPAGDRDPARALARAFERQKGQVVRCLDQHAEQVEDRVQLSVRVELDAAGSVHAVELSPQAIAAAPIGTCIAGAVRRMRFGPQAAAISFRVPLTARRSATQAEARR